jgi:hypothetical protein
MSKKNETGHAKNVANMKYLTTAVISLGTRYNPSNPDIYLANLLYMYENAASDQIKVHAAQSPYTTAVAARDQIFTPFLKELTKIRKALITSQDITPQITAGLMTLLRKYRGVRKVPKPKTDDPEILAKYHSVSQTSYDLRTDTLQRIIAYLENIPTYMPNEDNTKIATLQMTKEAMLNATDAVNIAFVRLNSGRAGRNQTFYLAPINLVKVGSEARTYALGILDKNQPEYNLFNSITFKRMTPKKQ